MTSTNLHLTIVLSLIGINTIGAVLYFFYGFFKTVKTGKPKTYTITVTLAFLFFSPLNRVT